MWWSLELCGGSELAPNRAYGVIDNIGLIDCTTKEWDGIVGSSTGIG